MAEDDVLQVFSIEEDWLLVKQSSGQTLGFVPRQYCDELDESANVAVVDHQEAEEDVEAYHREEAEAEHKRQLAEQQRLLKLKDQVETWSVSEKDGRKKKKGTLGVGNGAVFFASDNDKMEGVKQYAITELNEVTQSGSKELSLSFASMAQPLIFHCGHSDTAKAILAKLESSKAAAGEVLQLVEGTGEASEEEPEEQVPVAASAPEPKSVRWASDAPAAPAAGAASATVLYDFDAQGDDELTVKEDEVVTVVEQENDEWWTVRNSAGKEGVVPAQYVQLNDGSAPTPAHDDGEDERAREQEAAAAAAALEAERQREATKKAEERRAIERAARERAAQEEEDRLYAEQVEQKEIARAERRARRQQEEQRTQREIESARRRESARGNEPPKITKRPSVPDVYEAARNLPARGRNTPARPPENNRPKPTPGRTRVWSDKSGQFKVEAEYLGLQGNKVRLHKLNGVIIDVPLEKMSTEDVQLIRRHEARKARAALEEEDNATLARTQQQQQQQRMRQRSGESIVRAAEFEQPPKEAMQPQKPRKPQFDWFAFFLDAGCDMDDCTRYAAAFERDRIDQEILPDLESSTLRSIGLKEGDVIRVRKVIQSRYAKKTPEQEAQIKQDEDYARQLQEYESGGSKGPAPQPPPSLFTGPDGKLANNTRRGRPDKRSTGPESVDPSALAAVSEQLTGVSISSPSPPPAPAPPKAPSPPVENKLLSGFDDDAWTIKPSPSKPASPAPPPPPAPAPAAPSPAPANTTEQLLAQISAMRPASTGSSAPKDTGSFDKYAAMVGQPTGASASSAPIQQPQPTGYGLGVQGANHSMAQLANGPRGPLAPVPSNEGLLNPLVPAQTGFVPTRANGIAPQQTGFQPQPQQPQPMMMQPTGYAAGFQSAYGGQPQQIQPSKYSAPAREADTDDRYDWLPGQLLATKPGQLFQCHCQRWSTATTIKP